MNRRSSHPALPEAPVDLIAIAVDGWAVILAWSECGIGGLGFHIERADGFGSAFPFSETGRVGPHVTAYRDGSVKPCTNYSYRVSAWNASGDSSPSNVVEVTTPQAETEPPTGKE